MAYFRSINQVFAQIFQGFELKDFILKGLNKGFHTVMNLVDLQKAFDTVDHAVLL